MDKGTYEGRVIASQLFDYLEDRRVLYSVVEVELPSHCVQSVMSIREHLTQLLLSSNDQLDREFTDAIRAMRGACRRFLENTQRFASNGRFTYPAEAWELSADLGELRARFGVEIAEISEHFQLDVEGDLRKVLPPMPE